MTMTSVMPIGQAEKRRSPKGKGRWVYTRSFVRPNGRRTTAKYLSETSSAIYSRASVIGAAKSGFGLTSDELARVIGFPATFVDAWSRGRQPMSASAGPKLVDAGRLAAALRQIMPPELVGNWMRTPNPSFENQTPLQVVERGRADRLWRMIGQIDANVAN